MSETAAKPRRPGWFRRILLWLGIGFLLGFFFVVYVNLLPSSRASGRLYVDAAQVPDRHVALVFGCDNQIDGRENLYFRYRIEAATRLWEAGKVRCFIVSGDNRTRFYNEPQKMKQALVARGVPQDRIVEDFAGLRTLDSVVRAKEVFGAKEFIVVSQRFQNERALYLADANGIPAIGFNATDVPAASDVKTRLREIAARAKMWLDVNILSTRPQFLGDPIGLPE